MVYSTCSLNPVEDEAVIAALLEKSEGNKYTQTFTKRVIRFYKLFLSFIRAQFLFYFTRSTFYFLFSITKRFLHEHSVKCINVFFWPLKLLLPSPAEKLKSEVSTLVN